MGKPFFPDGKDGADSRYYSHAPEPDAPLISLSSMRNRPRTVPGLLHSGHRNSL